MSTEEDVKKGSISNPKKGRVGEDNPGKSKEKKSLGKNGEGEDYPERDPEENPYIGDNPDEIRRESPKL